MAMANDRYQTLRICKVSVQSITHDFRYCDILKGMTQASRLTTTGKCMSQILVVSQRGDHRFSRTPVPARLLRFDPDGTNETVIAEAGLCNSAKVVVRGETAYITNLYVADCLPEVVPNIVKVDLCRAPSAPQATTPAGPWRKKSPRG